MNISGQEAGSHTASAKAADIFRYLKEVAELRSTTTRTVNDYERVLWLGDLPEEPEVYSVVALDSGKRDVADDWIDIRKPPVSTVPPTIPAVALPWVDAADIANSECERPELKQSIPKSDQQSEEGEGEFQGVGFLLLEDHAEVSSRWQAYLNDKWMPWAEEDRRRRGIQRVYDELFSIHQAQQRLGEQYEVVLGIGLLNWYSGGQRVLRHIVTAQALVEFNASRGQISVKASPEGARLQLEEDMLDPGDRPPVTTQRQLQEKLTSLDNRIWESETVDEILRSWVNALSSSGSYEPSVNNPPYRGQGPLLSFSPALILRRRSERSMIQMFGGIAEQIQAEEDCLPFGIRRLVEVADDAHFREGPSSDADRFATSGEVYFPLLANAEQREIVQRLSDRQGVLVQGPPGTGKSHTIANLICHLLANGQRVLVTSHTARALEVLKDKIPERVADLCVGLLGDDRLAMKDLEASVAGITSRYAKWDAKASTARVAELESALAYNRSAAAKAIHSLQQYRERETRHLSVVEGYSGTSSAIATQVNEESDTLGWIPDDPSVEQEPPLSNEEFMALVALIRRVSPDQQLETRLPRLPSSTIPNPESFGQLVACELEVRQQGESSGFKDDDPDAIGARSAGKDDRQAILKLLTELLEKIETVGLGNPEWVSRARQEILRGRRAIWTYLADETAKHLDAINCVPPNLRSRSLEGIDSRSLDTVHGDLQPLLMLMTSGKTLGFGPFRSREVKQACYILDGVRLGGRRCDNLDTLQDLQTWLVAQSDLSKLRALWSEYAPVQASRFETQLLEFAELGSTIRRVLNLSSLVEEARAIFSRIPTALVSDWNNAQQLQEATRTINASIWMDDLAEAREPLLRLQRQVEMHQLQFGDAHPTSGLLFHAIRDRQTADYRDVFISILELERLNHSVDQAVALGTRFSAAAPKTAEMVRAFALDEIWLERAEKFEESWNWKRAANWQLTLCDPARYVLLQKNLTQCQLDIQSLLADLAAEKAWAHFFARLTERERQALSSWALSIRKLGKGTGKYAAKHRSDARAAMDECRSAIPAWIMPIYRVAQSIAPAPEVFDVVIIDEASQSGPDALFLQYIARRIIVVGDDKQISPEFIGKNKGEIGLLQKRYLKGVRNAVHMGVDNSLFDLAAILFSGRIRLREHFRCMPEIIQFSNQLAYSDDPLIPLKQFGASRLTPIRTTHVVDGYQHASGNDVRNPNEAKAIAAEIARCISLPEYKDMTMGVISLRGKAQAKEIEQHLLESVGAEAMEERQIHCGDAYTFQGDERDVIFLSMVSSRVDASGEHGARIRALTSQSDERRFNVAASRAREQMWLFHSVTLDDLNDRCLRYQLLDYCQNPRVTSQPREEDATDIFDSPFEEAVCEQLRARGYRVIPQYPVSNYRIDLVVEGMQGRLAVECDGDRWHGPERYQADMERQRQLERCGWTFWRVRGSEYYRDPISALEPLWALLERLDIHPERARYAGQPVSLQTRVIVGNGLEAETLDISGAGQLDTSWDEDVQKSPETIGNEASSPDDDSPAPPDTNWSDLHGVPLASVYLG